MTKQRRRRSVEWPTIALAAVVYATWILATWYGESLAWPIVMVLGGWSIAWHASLQHELIHGHPTRWPALNRALGLPPLMPHLPFDRYRALHLSHHRDQHLTDPLEDPETQYFTSPAWLGLGGAGRLVARLCARLAGRLVIGPAWTVGRFLWRDANRAWANVPGVRRAWLWHLPGLVVVMFWVSVVCRMSFCTYTLCFWLPGMALLLLRSLAEHRAEAAVAHRTAIVEQAPVLGFLFLFNNLHAAHHERPALAWYRLPSWYARERARLIAANGGLVYRGYADVARRFLFDAHDVSVHPNDAARALPLVEGSSTVSLAAS